MATSRDPVESLKRLGGGRWQTRDARFLIEPQSGTWVVVDAERTDDLGLPLVRGPFGSLTAAKAAIADLRDAPVSESPLKARAERLRRRPDPKGTASTAPKPEPATRRVASAPPAEPAEPRWISDLDPSERRRARRLVAALAAAGATDPEGLARRDIAGKVPAVATFAAAAAIRALGPGAAPAEVVRVLQEGRDGDLGVRWRLVDGDGRPISLDPEDLERR